jgi:iodotyrosine deiodinase
MPAEESRQMAAWLRERMAERRTVRAFSADPVDERLVLDAISVASTAPSGAQQPWTFVLVTDPDVRARIREAAEAEERKAYAGRLGEEWLAALRPLGTDEDKPHLTDAPLLIVVFAQRYFLDETSGRKHKHYYVDESVGIAVGMLLTTLHLAGLTALTHTPSPMRFLGEILERPRNEKAFAVIPVGYPADDAVVPDLVRKPLDQVLVRV